MKRLIENRIIIVRRQTRLDELIVRFNTIGQARFYIEHLGSSFEEYEAEHHKYYESLDSVKNLVTSIAKMQVIDRSFLPNFIFAKDDIIVVVGQDGIVANTLKYLNGQCLIGINPDRSRWDGVLLPFDPPNIADVIMEVAQEKRDFKTVTMGKIQLQNGQQMLAVNDFFIGQKTHTSARYSIQFNGKEESQSSSGIIISTGLGASGWMRSVRTGASGITKQLTTQKLEIKSNPEDTWSSDWLTFSVREPFPSKTTGTNILYGKIQAGKMMTVRSQMGENGVIFSDGIEKDFLEFNSGMEAKVFVADLKGKIII
ncbi:sugar kinase [Leptospira ognonensis]|uniref:Sugar kinase n=1 Tax=Leptospira ognonensis TaxID=2484945 RepID=A0A4R9K6L6_9LEPT|nr:sugar kinase [Leptospira ognonensis]TGL61919.1 sugar kinase [Leptospira ognonensis]